MKKTVSYQVRQFNLSGLKSKGVSILLHDCLGFYR
jgi:hypothetical protein